MCGIAGIVGPQQKENLLQILLDSQIHRGPDSQGKFIDDTVALGMRRLSIIDLEQGNQPKRDAHGEVIVFLNGEIYNHKEIRKKYPHFEYQSNSDTEVIPHLWADRGVSCLNELRGMFALSVWEPQKKCLTLIRDRLGIKPLWIYQDQNVFAYSSEIRAFAHAGLSLTLDSQAIWDYLTHSYIPAPRSPFKEVSLLLPGHFLEMTIDGKKWEKKTSCWWQLPLISEEPQSQIAVKNVRDLLEHSITEHMVSDVPLGSLLSGGLDSAVLTAWARKIKGEPIHTFSVGYANSHFDERHLAKELAVHLDCPHHSVTLESQNFFQALDRAVARTDTLLADQAIVALAPLYERVKEHVTVVLDGDGADEIFAGYPTVKADLLFQKISGAPLFFKKILRNFSQYLPESQKKASMIFKLERFLRYADLPADWAHALWRNIHPLKNRQEIVRSQWLPQNLEDLYGIYHWLQAMEGSSSLNAFERADMKVWLPDDNLKKVDGQSMGVSVEARVPFLDHRMVEMVLPWSLNLKRKYGVKGLLREACRDLLPEFARNRPKAGFHLPLTQWLQKNLKQEVKRRIFNLSDLASDYFNPSALKQYIENQRADAYSVFNLLVLESWWRQWPGKMKI